MQHRMSMAFAEWHLVELVLMDKTIWISLQQWEVHKRIEGTLALKS